METGDKKTPECQRCRVSGRKCIPAPLRPVAIPFRHGQNPSLRMGDPPRFGERDRTFSNDQVWVQTPSQGSSSVRVLVFLLVVSVVDYPDTVVFHDETDETAAYYQLNATLDFHSSPEAGLDRSELGISPLAGSPLHSEQYLDRASPHINAEPGSPYALPPEFSVLRPKMHDRREATLIWHFKQVLGPWVDHFLSLIICTFCVH
jgi:hypothetical protein